MRTVNNALYILTALVVLLAAAGCITPVEHDRDVPGFKTDYIPNAEYRLRKPVFLYQWDQSEVRWGVPRLELQPPGSEEGDYPSTIAEYERGRAEDWPRVLGVLPAGTVLQYKETLVTKSFESGAIMNPLFVIRDPKWESLGPVTGALISKKPVGIDAMLDPEYLELVSSPSRPSR